MIKFGLGGFEGELGGWAKHHKEYAVCIRREKLDGTLISQTESELLLKAIEDNEGIVTKKQVSLYDFETNESSDVIDYYLPLKNLAYKEPEINYYSVVSSNTSHETKVRLFFKLGYVDFILDYIYKSEGSYATNFYELLGEDNLLNILDDVALDESIGFEDKGIKRTKEKELYIAGIDEYKRPTEFEVSEQELLKSLIAAEVYETNMIVH